MTRLAVGLLLVLGALDLWASRLDVPPEAASALSASGVPPAIRLQLFEDVLAEEANHPALRHSAPAELKALQRHLGRAVWAEIRVLEGLDPGQAARLFALSEKVELQPLVQGMPVERLVGEAREAFAVAGAVPPEPWRLEDEDAALRKLAVRFEDLSQDPDETDRVWRRLLTLRPRQFLFAALRLRPDLRERQAEVLVPLLRTLADETLAYETRVETADALLRRSQPRLLRPMGRHAPIALDLYVELVEKLAAQK